jgi:multicomponent Na+:H+ antiporter subunit C
MSLALAAGAAILFGVGTYLVLQRTLTRIIIGLGLIGHGANLLLLVSGGRAGRAPVVGGEGALGLVSATNPSGYADPLPQALALTAIVISFGTTAFLLTLAYRNYSLARSDEVEDDIEDRRVARLEIDEEPT